MGTKVTVDDLSNLFLPSAIAKFNKNFDAVADEFDKVFYRDGSLDMNGNVDMDGHRILNLADAVTDNEPIKKGQLGSAISDITAAGAAQVAAATLQATLAKNFALAAASNLNPRYDTYADGIAATTAGQSFWIVTTDSAKFYIKGVTTGASNPQLVLGGISSGSLTSKAALAALPATANQVASVFEDAFKFSTANLSAAVSMDPRQGLYIAPLSDVTGASGAWVRVVTGDYLEARWFGTITTESYGAAAANWRAIQDALDYAAYYPASAPIKSRKVLLPGGQIYTSDTLHLGYGTNYKQFTTVELHGRGDTYNSPYGTVLTPTFLDRPVVNIQGCRNSKVIEIHILGNVQIANPPVQTLAWRANAANYVPAGAKDDRSAPFCGVCIDGYSNTAPTNPYPTPQYPAFMGAQTGAYGRAFSSDFTIKCDIENTLIGICANPNSNSNGDFGKYDDCTISYQKVAINIGESQARSNSYKRLNTYGCHTVWSCEYSSTSAGPGLAGTAFVAGDFNNQHHNSFYRLFNIQGNWSPPMVLSNFYTEFGMRIGDFGAGGGVITFSHGILDLSDSDRYNPNTEIWNEPCTTGPVAITFENVQFDFAKEAYFFPGATVRVKRNGLASPLFLRQAVWETPPTGARAKAALAMAGIFVTPDPNYQFPVIHDIESIDHPGFPSVGNWHSQGYQHYSAKNYDIANFSRVHNVGNFANASLSGRTITCDHDGLAQVNDLFASVTSGNENYWVVTTVSGGRMTLEAMFRHKLSGGVYTMFNTALPTNLVYFPNVFDVPTQGNTFFRATYGSTTLEIVDGDGNLVAVPSSITTASKPLWFGPNTNFYANTLPFPGRTVIAAVNANTLTMSQPCQVPGVSWWAMAPGIARIK